MWILWILASSVFLAFYDLAKKASVKENAVLPVLLIATIAGAAAYVTALGVAGGIDGAAQGMTDIRRFGRPEAETTLLWPFDPAHNKAYRMRLSAYRQ